MLNFLGILCYSLIDTYKSANLVLDPLNPYSWTGSLIYHSTYLVVPRLVSLLEQAPTQSVKIIFIEHTYKKKIHKTNTP